jgi:hypothetical protein
LFSIALFFFGIHLATQSGEKGLQILFFIQQTQLGAYVVPVSQNRGFLTDA